MKSKNQLVKELVSEHQELNGKVERLTDFLSEKHTGVSATQISWMSIQLHSMKNYDRCLKKRIEDLKAEIRKEAEKRAQRKANLKKGDRRVV